MFWELFTRHWCVFIAAVVALSGPNTSTLNITSRFSCTCFCHESLLVAWLINGSFRRSPQHATMTIRDHTEQCPSSENHGTNVLEVLTTSLHPFTVQCAAVHVHVFNQDGDDVTGCRTRVYYSQTVHVEGKQVCSWLVHTQLGGSKSIIITLFIWSKNNV